MRWVQLCGSLSILWHCLSLGFNENWPFPVLQPLLFSKFAGILSAALSQHHLLGLEITRIPSPPLALFVVMLPKAHLTLHSRMSGSRWVITPSWLSVSWRSILYSSSMYSCHLFLISSASVMSVQFSSVQSLSRVRLFATPWIAACQASLSITNSRSSLRLTSIGSVMPSSHFILYRPLLLLPSIPPSIKVFSNESTLRMRWPKYWSVSLCIIPSKEHPGLISFRMDWLDLLAVQGTLKSLLQHHSSKASILRCSAFFTVQLSYPYMTTGKIIALTRWTFVVISLFLICYLDWS